jgi:hypothetical protein
MQTDEEVGKVAAPVPVIIYILFNKFFIYYFSLFYREIPMFFP